MSAIKHLRGLCHAVLWASGLIVVSSPVFANNPSVNWYVEPAGTLTTPPVFAEQLFHPGGPATITIPGFGSASPYGGITWIDPTLTTSPGQTALLVFTLPAGITMPTCPGTFGGVDGNGFKSVNPLTCQGAAPNFTGMTASVVTGTPQGTAWYQLPSFTINNNAAAQAVFGAITANGGTANAFTTNCAPPLTGSNFAACYLTATSQALQANLSAVMITSGNVLALRTWNNSKLICIDVLEDQQPGTRFQQPCIGPIGRQVETNSADYPNGTGSINPNGGLQQSPTNVDGNVAGAVNFQAAADPSCISGDPSFSTISTAAEPQCGNGGVTGSLVVGDVLVADTGVIEIGVTQLLGADGVHAYSWASTASPDAIITLTGLCAGLESPSGNVGTIAPSCGIRPLTGQNSDGLGNSGYPGLTALTGINPSSGASQSIITPPTEPPGASAVCPMTPVIQGVVGSVSGGAQAQFDLKNGGPSTPLPNLPAGITINSTVYNSQGIYFELCGYANGTQVLGPVGQWFVSLSVDCGGAGFFDCTTLTDNPATAPAGQPADALLIYGYNGVGQFFQFTNGGTNYSAYLWVVNLMQNFSVSTGNTCATVDPNATCAPAGQVVCQVWGMDGQNAFVTLWPTEGSGLGGGKDAMYPVSQLFTQAGISANGNNPFDLGSLLCFHNEHISITQFWIEPNGSIVNIQ
jgi:hypothetical protein